MGPALGPSPTPTCPGGIRAESLQRATPGSAGLDLGPSSHTILTPEEGPTIIPTGVHGPPPQGMFFLIIGRASSTLKGLVVHPTLIDNDYTGEIRLIVSSPSGATLLSAGTRIAQAIPLPLTSSTYPSQNSYRGASTPGSSDVYWIQKITTNRPTLQLKLDGKIFQGILDTGADATVLSQTHWPQSWPLQPSLTHLQGIGQSSNTLQSSKFLKWEDSEGNSGLVRPFVVPGLPVNLWGRDILEQLDVVLCSGSEFASRQLKKQGWSPGSGLGKNLQGDPSPITVTQKTDKTGLGYPQAPQNFS